jgi:hypothetical protein
MTITIAIQIGNSDDKLTQPQWSEFVQSVDDLVSQFADTVHFMGGPTNYTPWQNVAWIFSCNEITIIPFKEQLAQLKFHYEQESIAWSVCNTEFI